MQYSFRKATIFHRQNAANKKFLSAINKKSDHPYAG